MAVSIKGRKVATGVESKHVTLPLAGMYLAKTKAGDAYSLYIDLFTSTSKEHRSYKQVNIITRDPSSLFCRLCDAFGVSLPAKISQKSAAELLAASMAEYGALKCVRAGKQHDWVDIHPVNLDVEALPWGFPSKEGMTMLSLWNPEESDGEEEGYRFSIIGKTLEQVADEIREIGGIPREELDATLERERSHEGVDEECYEQLFNLSLQAMVKGMDIIRLSPKKEESYVQA